MVATRSKKTGEPNENLPGMPLPCSKDCTSEFYIGKLLHVYEEQIKTLKDELDKKDNIIFDMLQIINSSKERKIFDFNERQVRENPSKNILPEPSSTQHYVGCQVNSASAITSANSDQEWQAPKKPIQGKSPTTSNPIETSNRYSLLDNEWLQLGNDSNSSDLNTSVTNCNANPPTQFKKKRRGKPTVNILGDSMVKDVKQWDLQPLIPNFKVFAKTFPGATTKDMVDYVKPSMNHEPDIIFLHTGTNDLRFNQTPHEIASSIIELASSMKTNENNVVVSSIIIRGDNFNGKAADVNVHLARMCDESNIGFLDNSNILLDHIQRGGKFGGIHLNERGVNVFKQNFIDVINF